jgi:hypothetical protein
MIVPGEGKSIQREAAKIASNWADLLSFLPGTGLVKRLINKTTPLNGKRRIGPLAI